MFVIREKWTTKREKMLNKKPLKLFFRQHKIDWGRKAFSMFILLSEEINVKNGSKQTAENNIETWS